MSKPTFKIVPSENALELKEFYFHLYHKPEGPNSNQSKIVDSTHPNSFGSIVVNDWPLYDGLDRNAKLFARAQGLHVQTGMITENWHNALSIVFEDARFRGSTLQVMGPVVDRDEWAIVGGTGQFTLAQGVIYKNFQKGQSDMNITELDIHGFYSPMRVGGGQLWSLGM